MAYSVCILGFAQQATGLLNIIFKKKKEKKIEMRYLVVREESINWKNTSAAHLKVQSTDQFTSNFATKPISSLFEDTEEFQVQIVFRLFS